MDVKSAYVEQVYDTPHHSDTESNREASIPCFHQVTGASQESEVALRIIQYAQNNMRFPVLHYAVKVGDIEAVKALLTTKINVNLRTHELVKENGSIHQGYTPIEIAVENNNAEITSLLLEHGADPYHLRGRYYCLPWQGCSEETPSSYSSSISEAINKRMYKILRILVNHHVDFHKVCCKESNKNLSGFDLAINSKDPQVVAIIMSM